MSPILTRPIREQLEHDRIIRQLQARYKRKHEVAINPGPEQNESVMVGELAVYPDLLLYSQERSRRLEGTVEVETGESVNQLEALAEWGVFSKLKAPFYLYVPPQCIESARRICDEHQFPVTEIWTYHLSMDQVRFTQVYRSPNAPRTSAAEMDGADAGQAKAPPRAAVARGLSAGSAEKRAKPGTREVAGKTARSAKKTQDGKDGKVRSIGSAKSANGKSTSGKNASGKNGKSASGKGAKNGKNGKNGNAKNGTRALTGKAVTSSRLSAPKSVRSAKASKATSGRPVRGARPAAKPTVLRKRR